MDPLSIAASISGILMATKEIGKLLRPYVSAVKDTPQIAAEVHAEVQATGTIIEALQKLTVNFSSFSQKYAVLIPFEDVIAVLGEGVCLFSDLNAALSSLSPADSAGAAARLRNRMQWARKDSTLAALLTRLQRFKLSTSLILTILQRQAIPLPMAGPRPG
jgi:cell division control protein 24